MGLPFNGSPEQRRGHKWYLLGHKPPSSIGEGGFYVPQKGAVESHIMSMSRKNNESLKPWSHRQRPFVQMLITLLAGAASAASARLRIAWAHP